MPTPIPTKQQVKVQWLNYVAGGNLARSEVGMIINFVCHTADSR